MERKDGWKDLSNFCFIALLTFIFTALHGTQTRSSDQNSARPSVKRVYCDKTEGTTYDVHLRLIGKRVVDFPLMLI